MRKRWFDMLWEVKQLESKLELNSTAEKEKSSFAIKMDWKNHTSLAGLIVLIIISAVLSPTFLSPTNLLNIATQIAAPGIIAIGMTFVILTGGIDLSVGSLLALTGVIIAITAPVTGWPLAVVLAIVAGTLIGAFHGFSITKLKVPAFIVTLAGLTAYKGLALILTGSAAVPIQSTTFAFLGSGKISGVISSVILVVVAGLVVLKYVLSYKSYMKHDKVIKTIKTIASVAFLLAFAYFILQVGGMPVQVFFFLAIFAIAWFVLNKTVFGREVYAIGGNPEAAHLAGVKVNKGLVIVYSIAGFTAAIGGMLIAARLGSGTPQVGTLGELDAIAAVVIGGTSLMGGVGKLGGTIIGVILIGILNNLLSLMNVTADMQMLFKGIIILGAVVLNANLSKK